MSNIAKVEPRGQFLDVTLDDGEEYSVVWNELDYNDNFWGKAGVGKSFPENIEKLNAQLKEWVQTHRPMNLAYFKLESSVFHLQSQIEELLDSFAKSNGYFDISIDVSKADMLGTRKRKDGFIVKVKLAFE